MKPQLRLFLVGIVCVGVAGGIFETTFNNFLSDQFQIDAQSRGRLEFPRELPGFLTVVMAATLFFFAETLVAAIAAFAVGLGMIGIALYGQKWGNMVGYMILWSAGLHLMMPIRNSITLRLAVSNRPGRRLGQVNAAGLVASFIGCSLVWYLLRHLRLDYSVTFMAGGIAAILGGTVFLMIRIPGAPRRRQRFVWRRRYWLFYVMELLFGARKQIFITFGPWVLVKVFDQPAHIFAQLWMASALIGVFFQQALGNWIDRFGERRILIADSICIAIVCAGYGLAHLMGNRTAALWLLYACYVGDQLLFGVGMARTTYLSKIAARPEDVAPSLSLGVTINHAVSMSIPALGGIMWMKYGHTSVFLGAMGIAALMLIFSSLVTVPTAGASAEALPSDTDAGHM